MKKALSIAGIIALTTTPAASFADHLEPRDSEIRICVNLSHSSLNYRGLSNVTLATAKYFSA